MIRTRKVVVVGAGAREHALVRALCRSGAEVVAAPGNPGIEAVPNARVVPVAADDVDGLVALVAAEKPDLVVVGPEKPLTLGLADVLRQNGVPVFGPGRAGAALEGSKSFMKEFLSRCSIPTAAFRVFDDADVALAYVRAEARPLVVKADGLAAGKGVVVAANATEASDAVIAMMKQRVFGEAGARVVIEDVLPGSEASFHVICGGNADRVLALAPAQDHKRAFDGDRGPNTGGMGAYAPAPVVTPSVLAKVMKHVVGPTLRGFEREGIDYRGVLFVGLMIDRGEPSVLEFNVRFGDPEATVILPALGERAFEVLLAAAEGAEGKGNFPAVDAEADATVAGRAALSVVLAAERYPETPVVGDVIEGLEAAAAVPGSYVHHAGTRRNGASLVTAGGRVLTVTGEGATVAEARARAYEAAAKISFRGRQYRTDIGWQAIDTAAGVSP